MHAIAGNFPFLFLEDAVAAVLATSDATVILRASAHVTSAEAMRPI